MSDIHAVIRKIKSKNDLLNSMTEYCRILAEEGHRLAMPSLALSDVAFYEEVSSQKKSAADPEKASDPVLSAIAAELNALVSAHFSGSPEENEIEKVIELRKRNTERMVTVTECIDIFAKDEYLLNRLEHAYDADPALPEDHDDMELTTRILSHLASGGTDGQNLLISEITAELPVRMTKSRFLEMVSERLSVYKTSDATSFRSMLGMVRSAAGIGTGNSEIPVAPGLKDLDEELRNARSDMPESEYRRLSSSLEEAGITLGAASDCSESMQHVLNALLSVLLAEHAVGKEISDEASIRIVNEISALFAGADESVLDQAYEDCEALEGRIEEIQEEFASDSAFLSDVRADMDSFGTTDELDSAFEAAGNIVLLMSNSIYAPLEARIEEQDETVDDAMFEREVSELLKSYSALFAGTGKLYTRAVMGRTISVLPPRFTSQEELETYIYGALSSCTLISEKLACIELLEDIMRK